MRECPSKINLTTVHKTLQMTKRLEVHTPNTDEKKSSVASNWAFFIRRALLTRAFSSAMHHHRRVSNEHNDTSLGHACFDHFPSTGRFDVVPVPRSATARPMQYICHRLHLQRGSISGSRRNNTVQPLCLSGLDTPLARCSMDHIFGYSPRCPVNEA
jgi:hypothetical protein